MKALIIGLVVGLCALGVAWVLDIEINLANYLLGYVAGSVAMFASQHRVQSDAGDSTDEEDEINPYLLSHEEADRWLYQRR